MNARLNTLDRLIAVFAPGTAVNRARARVLLDTIRTYDAAASGRRTSGWRTSRTSSDAEIARGLPVVRNRSRDLSRNNPHARKAKSVWVGNIVGTGIVPRSATGNPRLDEQLNSLWAEWAAVADADGQLDMGGLQELMVGEMIEGGEALVRRRFRRPEDGLPVPLQLQVLEGDLLDESRTRDLGGAGRIVNGVEFDPIGRRRAYWMYSGHPGDVSFLASPNVISAPVPATEILHLYHKERTQTRGMPWCAAVVMALRDRADYADAERVRKKTEACLTGIVQGGEADLGMAPAAVDAAGTTMTDANGNRIEQFEPGMIAYLPMGREIEFNNPTQTGGFPDVMRLSDHEIAAGYLIPYELLTSDFSDVNFSSSRAGLIDFRARVEARQWLCVIPMALQPIWNWFVDAAYLAGRSPVRVARCEWDTPAFTSVQPLDDVNADLAEVRAGFNSLFAVIAKRTGRNARRVLAEIADGNVVVDENGLILDSDPRRTARSGAEQAAPSQQSQEPPRGQPRLVAGGRQ